MIPTLRGNRFKRVTIVKHTLEGILAEGKGYVLQQ